jgi:general secretion pathway protein M
MLQQINDWWLSLESRERQLLKLMLGFLALVLVYLLIWKPVQTSKLEAEQKLKASQQEWEWLNQQVPLVKQNLTNSNAPKRSNLTTQNSLLQKLQTSLRKQKLFKQIKTVQGIKDGGRVSFDEVKASRLMKWLATLEREGLVPSKMQMNSIGVDLVKAKVEFTLSK